MRTIASVFLLSLCVALVYSCSCPFQTPTDLLARQLIRAKISEVGPMPATLIGKFRIAVTVIQYYVCSNNFTSTFKEGQTVHLEIEIGTSCGYFSTSNFIVGNEWLFNIRESSAYTIENGTITVYPINLCGTNTPWSTLSPWTIYQIQSCDYKSPDPCAALTTCKNCKYQSVICIKAPCPPVAVCADTDCSIITDPAKCKETVGCRAFTATPCNSSSATPTPTFVGCGLQSFCTAALTCQVNSNGERYIFSDGCAPPGWNVVGSSFGCCTTEPTYCSWDGQKYTPGQTVKQDCNTCTCGKEGQWMCTEMACLGSCKDLSDVSFGGDCKKILGYGVQKGRCVPISGCNSTESLFQDIESCWKTCFCQNFAIASSSDASATFGTCQNQVGWANVNGKCIKVTGCIGAQSLFATEIDCQRVCFGCVDGDKKYAIGEVYQQDCNSCTCTYSGPICTAKACSGTCKDLALSTPPVCTTLVNGYGISNGACVAVCPTQDGLFSSLDACNSECKCASRSGYNFGNCGNDLGWAVIGDICTPIKGCKENVGTVPLFPDQKSCLFSCPRRCIQDDVVYAAGSSWKDGCNICSCTLAGEVVCTKIACQAPCQDLFGIQFGNCDAVLGYGVINGKCTSISGCSAPAGISLFSDLKSCWQQCSCLDRAELNFGACKALLGWGIKGGYCVPFGGCPSATTNAFFETEKDCQDICVSKPLPCQSGFTGLNCDKKICAQDADCKNGFCQKNILEALNPFCVCKPGYYGTDCSTPIDCKCQKPQICSNEGKCTCPPGTSGDNCTAIIVPKCIGIKLEIKSLGNLTLDELKKLICSKFACDISDLTVEQVKTETTIVLLVKFCENGEWSISSSANAFVDSVNSGSVSLTGVEVASASLDEDLSTSAPSSSSTFVLFAPLVLLAAFLSF